MSFGLEGIPLDILPIYILTRFIPDYTILIADGFLGINGINKEEVQDGRDELVRVLNRLGRVHGKDPSLSFFSDFSGEEKYQDVYRNLRERVDGNKDLTTRVLKYVPERRRNNSDPLQYIMHQVATVQHLYGQGYQTKLGPKTELGYDGLINELGINIDFAYTLDSLALGTKTPDPIVPYIPSSKGPNNGQRVFFHETPERIQEKINQGCDEALRYFLKLASISGFLLGLEHLSPEEIGSLYSKTLKGITRRLVKNNIVIPYLEAA